MFALGLVCGALIAAAVIGLVWLVHSQRAEIRALRADVARLAGEMSNLKRADNGLYRESIEDVQARQLRAASDVATGIEFMVQAVRILNPELLKKSKR